MSSCIVLPLYYFETGPLTELETRCSGKSGGPVSLWDLPVSVHLMLGLQAMQSFYVNDLADR